MEIVVKKNTVFKEVKILEGNATVETGLLNGDERIELAHQFALAIVELLEE